MKRQPHTPPERPPRHILSPAQFNPAAWRAEVGLDPIEERGINKDVEAYYKSRLRKAPVASKYTFDVDFAHSKDTLKAGEIVGGTHRVSVLAHHETEGQLMANQMVAAGGREPTGARRVR